MFNLHDNDVATRMCVASGSFCFAIVAIAILLQVIMDLPHCAQCVLQRWIVTAIGVTFFVTVIARQQKLFFFLLGLALSFWGFNVSFSQVVPRLFEWMNSHAHSGADCSFLYLGLPLLAACSFSLFFSMNAALGVRCYQKMGFIINKDKAGLAVMAFIEKKCGIMALISTGFLLYFAQPYIGVFAFNKTDSLPQKLFFVSTNKHNIQQGDLVGFRLSPDGQGVLLIKEVVGVAGDVVSVKNNAFYINDKAMGIILPKTRGGEPLTPIRVGTIPKNAFFAYTPHPLSFDSRYEEMGLISKDKLMGKAYAMF